MQGGFRPCKGKGEGKGRPRGVWVQGRPGGGGGHAALRIDKAHAHAPRDVPLAGGIFWCCLADNTLFGLSA